MKYRSLNAFYREKVGCKVYKLSLDGGFTCPNRDGTLGCRGCIFCSADGGGEFTPDRLLPVQKQLELAREKVAATNPGGKYIAYFQSFTNTYGPAEQLEPLYRAAMAPEDVVGLAVGTRPDCLPEPVLDLLEELNREKFVSVELGFQTMHPRSVSYIRRGYDNRVYREAVERLKARGLNVVTHIILGLPGETPEMAAQTTRFCVDAGTDGVKFHLLHVLRGPDLEKEYLAGRVQVLSLPQYGAFLQACIRELPPQVVVHRITGDGARRTLVAPQWSLHKKQVLNYLNALP